MTVFRALDRITWTYRHYTNGRTFTRVTRHGVYHGKIRHTSRYKGSEQLALVSFDGNKRASKVPVSELRHEES